jgi:hypothetical protein
VVGWNPTTTYAPCFFLAAPFFSAAILLVHSMTFPSFPKGYQHTSGRLSIFDFTLAEIGFFCDLILYAGFSWPKSLDVGDGHLKIRFLGLFLGESFFSAFRCCLNHVWANRATSSRAPGFSKR